MYVYVNKEYPRSYFVADEKVDDFLVENDIYEVDSVPENQGVYDFVNGDFVLNYERKVKHDEWIKQQTIDAAKKKSLSERSLLLKKGTLTADKRFYFTERTAEKFVMDYASLEGDEKLVWKDTNKNIVHLSKEEAKPYVTEIKTVLRKVYGLEENNNE